MNKFSNLGTNSACFENIFYFSRHDVDTYGLFNYEFNVITGMVNLYLL